MGQEFTFYNYVNDDGVNEISSWLKTRPLSAWMDFNAIIGHLEATPIAGWNEPQVKFMKGVCLGLFELRTKAKRQHHRILGYIDGERAILVQGGVKTGNILPPSYEDVCGSAFAIKAKIQSDPAKYLRIHEEYE